MERYTLSVTGDGEVVAVSLWAAGAVGVWDRDGELVAWFATRHADVPPGGAWSTEDERDWTAEWKAGLEPVTVGAITIAPSWSVDDLRVPSDATDAVVIVLDPGMAFGTGHHATTRLCLEALQRVGVRGRRVLDVGTGSGVLAIAAARLGASAVVGVDTDPDAIDVARANAAANGVAITLATGTVTDAGGGRFDVVVANLVTDTVLELADALLASTAGTLIASGISVDRADDVIRRFQDTGNARVSIDGDWVALTVELGGGSHRRPAAGTPRAHP